MCYPSHRHRFHRLRILELARFRSWISCDKTSCWLDPGLNPAGTITEHLLRQCLQRSTLAPSTEPIILVPSMHLLKANQGALSVRKSNSTSALRPIQDLTGQTRVVRITAPAVLRDSPIVRYFVTCRFLMQSVCNVKCWPLIGV